MDVSIIIVNYKTVHLILSCLKSIETHTQDILYEIIVVDNNSEDNFQTIIQSRFPKVKCLSLKENLGFGKANNEGYKIAKGRNIFYLNPDTILLNNAIKILSDYLDANKNVGACGGNLYDELLKPALSFRRIFPSLFWEFNELFWLIPEKLLYHSNRIFNNGNRPIRVSYITGADLMTRRVIIDNLKGFSPEFFMYYEETDLCKRIWDNGWEIHSIPMAKIQHLEGKSFKNKDREININQMMFSEKGRKIYYSKNYSRQYQYFANIIHKLFLYSRLVVFSFFNKYKYEKYKILNKLNNQIS